MQDGVVLLHGILRSNRSTQSLANFLLSKNYKILNLDYPSAQYDILAIADLLHPQIQEFAAQVNNIHFIGHSMGGLVIRAYLHKYHPVNLGRVIMLGTPNHGSEIADFLQNSWFYKKIFGPAGQQLVTDQTKFKAIFGKIDYELGIISGVSSFYFIANRIMGKEGDGRVSIASTKIAGMKDHVTIEAGHTLLAANKNAWQLILAFLTRGSFR